jgi:murein DD-endopeptidase MepM/ murein hydrolase activator NlpD
VSREQGNTEVPLKVIEPMMTKRAHTSAAILILVVVLPATGILRWKSVYAVVRLDEPIVPYVAASSQSSPELDPRAYLPIVTSKWCAPVAIPSDANLSGVVFFDYNGDGSQDADEPGVLGAHISLGDKSTSSQCNGVYYFRSLPYGPYSITVTARGFGFIANSASDFQTITTPVVTQVGANTQRSLGLMQGFFTWPFPEGTEFTRDDYLGRDSVFDRDPAPGSARAYDPSIPSVCTGGVCVYDGHKGTDIGVEIGVCFVAAAPLEIVEFDTVPGHGGLDVGRIHVRYDSDYTGTYAHAQLLPGIQVGDQISRGQEFGCVERFDIGASHLHFEVQRPSSVPIDPYADVAELSDPSLWSIRNDPQYPP